jgi:hypothetical protein
VQGAYPNFNPSVLIYLEYVAEAVILILLLTYRPKGLIPEGRVETKAYELFDFTKSKTKNNNQQDATKALGSDTNEASAASLDETAIPQKVEKESSTQ